MPGVFDTLRGANIALRWLLLHTAASNRRLRAAVTAAAPSPAELVSLLLDTAVLESEVTAQTPALAWGLGSCHMHEPGCHD
jgi:hypothetical protein